MVRLGVPFPRRKARKMAHLWLARTRKKKACTLDWDSVSYQRAELDSNLTRGVQWRRKSVVCRETAMMKRNAPRDCAWKERLLLDVEDYTCKAAAPSLVLHFFFRFVLCYVSSLMYWLKELRRIGTFGVVVVVSRRLSKCNSNNFLWWTYIFLSHTFLLCFLTIFCVYLQE